MPPLISRRQRFALLLAAAAAFFVSPGAQAQDAGLPLYEIDAVALAAYTPDYPGSDQMHAHFLPLPWLAYRGKILRTDEPGSVAGRVINSSRFSLDVSAMGSFPVSSNDNRARDGMPDLDWMGEIGPKARLTLYNWTNQATNHTARINLELPVRAVFSTDLSEVHYRGIITNPSIAYDNNRLLGGRVKLGIGPMFATEELPRYFYQVDPAYARADRPSYQASGGYMGVRTGLRMAVPVGDRVTILGSGNLDMLNGAANDDSPLMKEKTNVSIMLGVSVSLYRSQQTVPSR